MASGSGADWKSGGPRKRAGAARAPAPSPAPVAEPALADPGSCLHHCLHRLGIQEIGVWPYRVHLVVCAECGTTQTTESLRSQRRRERQRAKGPGEPKHGA